MMLIAASFKGNRLVPHGVTFTDAEIRLGKEMRIPQPAQPNRPLPCGGRALR
jgi:hypothetical protein